MAVSYIDQFTYLTSPEGLETGTLLGNSLRLSRLTPAGSSLLNVTPNTTVTLNAFDTLTIYDGLLTERVQVAAAGAASGSSNILLLNPTQNAHNQYTSLSSPGTLGDLGGEILKAGAWLENITKQSLWATTQTETLRIPTLRASFDNQSILTFRTKQYPITAINSLQIGTTQSNFVSYDPTQCFIDANELVTVPVLNALGGTSSWPLWPQQMDRASNAYLQVNYTAGYAAGSLPYDVVDAAVLLTNALLSRRFNPVGAAEISQGHQTAAYRLRGDKANELADIHFARAAFILANYTLRMF